MDFSQFGKLLERSHLDHKQHQFDGVRWCLKREEPIEENAICGGIMADEMGLGKTIQMLGIIVCNFKRRTLIILPKSLLNQWITTISKIYNHAPLVYHGQHVKSISLQKLNSAPIVVSTYGMLNHKKENNLLHKINWDRIIFDEAHHLRNKDTTTQTSVLKIRKQSIIWLVTGTPIQNRITDLHSLYKILGIPKTQYVNPQNHIDLIKKYIIKRNKKDIKLNIPKVNEKNIYVEWKDEQEKDVAEELHLHSVTEKSNFRLEKSNFNNPYDKPLLPFTMFAKQMCVCPTAFQPHLFKLLKEEKHQHEEDLNNTLITGNSKLDSVIKTLLENKNNRKKIVFCQFKTEINAIMYALKSNGFVVEAIDGTTAKKKRNEILENQEITDANYTLIIQIQVGCEGLNLQTFSEVYFVSPNWNPAIEDQAIARCHRIGQKQEVNIYRFYMNDFNNYSSSLDTHIKNKQDEKRKIMI
tara:strand:+ start:458 stop:1861 length:1404 start_codon:yes stop_codon:yes gene_type:complete